MEDVLYLSTRDHKRFCIYLHKNLIEFKAGKSKCSLSIPIPAPWAGSIIIPNFKYSPWGSFLFATKVTKVTSNS